MTAIINNQQNKKELVQNMFNQIAPRYDFLNHILSFGIDYAWRNKSIRLLSAFFRKKKEDVTKLHFLDIATGTGDLAFKLSDLNPAKITAIDLANEMLKIAEEKKKKKWLMAAIDFIEGDGENLVFQNQSFDAITIAFGIRNFSDVKKGLAEMYRVLKPTCPLMILEFSKTQPFFIRTIFKIYFFKILPFIGKIISPSNSAYLYLPNSVENFYTPSQMIQLLNDQGFKNTRSYSLSFGIAYIYWGEK